MLDYSTSAKRVIFALYLLSMLAFAWPAKAASDLLINGSFERGGLGWACSGSCSIVSAADCAAGSCAVLNSSGISQSVIGSGVDCSSHRLYFYSARGGVVSISAHAAGSQVFSTQHNPPVAGAYYEISIPDVVDSIDFTETSGSAAVLDELYLACDSVASSRVFVSGLSETAYSSDSIAIVALVMLFGFLIVGLLFLQLVRTR